MSQPITSFSITAPGFLGLNTQDSPVDMDPKFSLEAYNCVIDRLGRVGARKGWSATHSTNADLGTAAVETIGELVGLDGATTLLCAGNGKLFKFVSGSPSTLLTLTYGGGGVAPVISANNWQTVMLNGAMMFWQRGYDCLIYDPSISTTQFRRLSEHPLYSGSAPQAHCALSAYGRIWAADTSTNKDTVYWSDTLTYMKWTGGTAGSLNLYGVWPQGADQIVALAAHNNQLIIFGRRQILIYSGADNPTEMRLQDAISNAGCVGRDTVVNTPSDIFFLSDVGFGSIMRTIQEKSAPLGLISRNVNDDILQYTQLETSGDTIKAAYSPIDSFVLLTFTTSRVTYCFDTRSRLPDGSSKATTWVGFNPKCYCYCEEQSLKIGLARYIGEYGGYTDNGAAYRMAYYTSWVDFGDPVRTSILKKIIMTLFGALNQSIVYKWGFDYQSTSQAQPTVTSTVSPSEYNVAEYGIAEYSGNLAVQTLSVNATGAGKVIQIGFETQVNGFPISIQRVDIYTKNGAYK